MKRHSARQSRFESDEGRVIRCGHQSPGTKGALRLVLFPCMILAVASSIWAEAATETTLPAGKGAWLGQTPPGELPLAFAPDIFAALGPWVEAVDFSPDGNLCLVSVGSATYASARLFFSRSVDGVWSPFAEPPFTAGFRYSNEPVFLADGKTLQFTGMKSPGSKDLWTLSYSDKGWGEPVALPAPINSEYDEFRGSRMRDGTIYFASERSGMNQVYRCTRDAAGLLAVSLVGPPISQGSIEADPCIAPDGSYLIFMSCKDRRSSNNYVSFNDGNGGWGPAIGLGEGFNSPNDEYGAHLYLDGKYLFFTRHGKTGNSIFWVAASAIEKRKR